MGRVFGLLEVNSVRKKCKIYLNFKIPEIFGFLDLGLSLVLSETTHVRSQTKFQLIWAINTAFTRGGLNQPPPLTQMCSWDPLTIRVKENFLYRRLSNKF